MKKSLRLPLIRRGITFLAIGLLMSVSVLAQTLPTAATVAGQMTIGWNIGNSLECPGSETAWGNPVVSQTLINAVKAAGFNSIRIPCAWDSHADQTTLTIDPTWLARVKQVVDYCITNNMYVILNIHYDGGWLESYPLYANQVAVNAKQKSYWTQIATYFKTYNEHLLFAGTNEVHADYSTPTTENITVQQSYNQTFVDAVRATGGNNASRTLVVQTYNTNISYGLTYFSLPTDAASSRLIVEVHNYDPYDYTLNTTGSCLYWGAAFPVQSACTWAQEAYFDDMFAQVKTKWVNNGVPVIIGEYGVIKRTSLTGQQLIDHIAARQYYLKYVTKSALTNGIKSFYWDNGFNGNNGLALFDRNSGAVVDQGAIDALMLGAGVGNPNVNYTLATTVNGSGTVTHTPTGTSFPGGTAVTITATAASGYDFLGWSGDLTGTANPATINMSANITVTANFALHTTGGTGTILREYWNNITGGTITSLTSLASYPNSPTGSEQLTSLEGPTNVGDNYGARYRGYIFPPISGAYTFWIAGDDYASLYLSTSSDPALATRIAYEEGYTNSREWTKYTTQKSVTINLTVGQKYYIEVLHKESTGGDNVAVAWQGPGIAQAVITGNYLSPFVPTTTTNYTLTAVTTGTGSVSLSPTGGTYAQGTVVTVTATAGSGYQFSGWSGDLTGSTNPATITMNANKSVTATFTQIVGTQYTLAVSIAGQGTVAPNGGTFASGTSVTLTATPAAGYQFSSWSGAVTGTTNPATVVMNANKTVTATFAQIIITQYTLTVNVTGQGTVAPTGGSFASGTTVNLTATPATGYHFTSWSGGVTGTTSPVALLMNANKTVTALFDVNTSTCANPVTISIPFVQNGVGIFCWVTSTPISYINSWNMTSLTINGVDYTNKWSNSLPPAQNGQWFISYSASVSWAHFEAPQAKSAPVADEGNNEIHLFPNPFISEINMTIANPEQVEHIVVLDQLGRQVETIDHAAVKSIQVIGSSLKAGMYIIKVYGINKLQSFKVIKNQ